MPLSLVGRDPEAAFYGALVARRGGPVLVLGAADAELAFTLAGKGTSVTAVEPSAFLMEKAEARKAQDPTVPVKLLQSDLRSLRLNEKFNVVLAPKSALALAPGPDALDAVLETVCQHLTKEGVFACEVSGLLGSAAMEGPMGRSLFAAHLRERKGTQAPIRRMRRASLTVEELTAALLVSGLEAREEYADFEGKPWEEGGDRQIVVAGLKT
jgi:SAM-dependent methyltransferase